MAWIEKEILRRGAVLKSAAGDGTDGNSPTDVLLRRIVDAFAEFERLLIGSRTSAALREKKRKGEFTGGGTPFGFSLGDDGRTLLPVEEELAVIGYIHDCRGRGDSYRAIARKLKIKGLTERLLHPQTVKRLAERLVAEAVTAV